MLPLILADAPLAEETWGKQVVPGCPWALLCFADEQLTSSSQEQIVAARLARRPLLPMGAAEASDGLGGEAALSSAGTAEMSEPSGTSSVTSSLSQWRRWAASFCIRVLTEEAAASGLKFSTLLGAGLAGGGESPAAAGAGGGAWGDTGLGEQGFAEADSTGCSFSELETSTAVSSEQRFFDGDGFVQDFSSPPGRGCWLLASASGSRARLVEAANLAAGRGLSAIFL